MKTRRRVSVYNIDTVTVIQIVINIVQEPEKVTEA